MKAAQAYERATIDSTRMTVEPALVLMVGEKRAKKQGILFGLWKVYFERLPHGTTLCTILHDMGGESDGKLDHKVDEYHMHEVGSHRALLNEEEDKYSKSIGWKKAFTGAVQNVRFGLIAVYRDDKLAEATGKFLWEKYLQHVEKK